jgi:hypothetical protein
MDLSRDWAYIEQVALERLENNVTEHHVSDYGTIIETIGAAGELAARRFFGLSEQLHVNFDHGADMTYMGKRVDVKATQLNEKIHVKHLQWPHEKQIKADVVLMTAIDTARKTGTVLGYAYRDEVEDAPINPDRPYLCHEIPITRLHPAWELLIHD